MKFLLLGASPRSIFNFRGQLIKDLINRNWSVVALASGANSKEKEKIISLNCKYIDYKVSRNGLNPLSDLHTLSSLLSIFKNEKPNIILAYTIKPIIWGGIASRFIPNCQFYALVTGLGFSFQGGSWKKSILQFLVKSMYKLALKNANKVIFQNSDNKNVFVDEGIIPERKSFVVRGSGVDVNHFDVKPLPKKPVFLLIARLLGDKGIKEYILASNIVKEKYPNVEFHLVGPEDPSPDGISSLKLKELNAKGSVCYHGSTNDVRPFIKNCSIFVLPSYHEGLPRTVLEAMATGRPILTTDVPGCRETVVPNHNGFLVEKGNVFELAEKMEWFIENHMEWPRLATNSRTMVEELFDVNKVNTSLFEIMSIE